MSTIEETAARIRDGAAALAARRNALDAGRPWPLSEHFGVEPEASWGPMETLAHVAEMIPYWLGQAELVIDAGEPVPFGRMQSDVVRIGLIERDRILPPRELLTRIVMDADRAATRLSTMTATETSAVGIHPRLGETTVETMLERFIAGHLEEHVRQLDDIVDRASASRP